MDLRYADFTSPEVKIHAYSIMGGQTVLVPPEVNVGLHGCRRDGPVRPPRTRAGPAGRTSDEGPRLLAVGKVTVSAGSTDPLGLLTQIGRTLNESARFGEAPDYSVPSRYPRRRLRVQAS